MKRASLVFFYFGEQSYINRLAQETVPLHLALEGYDRSVLLHHETKVDAKHATVVDLPTKENLVAQINDLGAQGYAVDLFVFSHGMGQVFVTSKGTYGDNELVTAKYLERQTHVAPLRAVWQCNCYGASLNPTWQKLGARVSSGSRFVNFYPTQFRGFMNAWRDGSTFFQAVRGSNTAAVRTPVQTYLLIDAAVRRDDWGGQPLQAAGVLGRTLAAERYFRACWLGNDWQPGKSGKVNMNHSSYKLIVGEQNLLW